MVSGKLRNDVISQLLNNIMGMCKMTDAFSITQPLLQSPLAVTLKTKIPCLLIPPKLTSLKIKKNSIVKE